MSIRDSEMGEDGVQLNSSGFSLLELLTVLVLLGVLAAVSVPAIGRFMENLSFRKQVGSVVANLRYVRLKSVTTGEDILVTLDDDGRVMRLTGGLQEERFLDIVDEALLVLEPGEIVFSPKGYVTPARLTLSQEKRSQTIMMDPLTALPVIQ
ncbi:MAG: prepilin-type N-terminal cleavage/methylation domain-containing protein [Thermodesulfobacteriota bacterium]|nr:prepilin-type N-terminal cleavage/methylation domain-containing protein [Thermodesulfobacteriota bacterium]